jgi:DNA-binding XRE family transcriptional regulator
MGLTMDQFGELAGVTGRTILNYEKGKTTPSATIYKDMCVIYRDFKNEKKVSEEIKKTTLRVA